MAVVATIVRKAFICALLVRRLQTKHVQHRIQSGFLTRQPCRRPQCSAHECISRVRAVTDSDCFAQVAEMYSMLANRVSYPQRVHADLACLARAHSASSKL